MTFASYITSLRVILILPIIYFMSVNQEFIALLLFIFAGLTDYIDGFIARKTGSETSLGALLDLLADKLLVCIVLIWCTYLNQSTLIIFSTLIIITRELVISSVRQFLVEKMGENPIKVTYIAKSKTTIQIVAISFLIISPQMGELFNKLAITLIFIAALISVYSLYNYLYSYRHCFRTNK